MSEWVDMHLSDIATIEIGGTPSREIMTYWAGPLEFGFPWVSIADLKKRIITETKESITDKGVINSNVKLISPGTLIMSFKLSIGRAALTGINLYTNEAIAAITPKNKDIHPIFLYYVLPSVAKHAITDTAVKGVTLNKASLSKLICKIPLNYFYQQKIVHILQTIDNTIEATEALIEKYQQIKAGLMHDLFTRGIGADGKLRPTREQAPDLYKETALGWIPKEWGFSTLNSVLLGIDSGWSPDCIEITPASGEWGVLKVSSVTRGFYDPNESKTLPYALAPIPSLEVKNNDVIMTRANGVAELVGKCVRVSNTPEKLMLSDKLLRLNPDIKIMSKLYLGFVMDSSIVKRQIDKSMNGSSGQRNISQKDIRSFYTPIPKEDEQNKITDKLAQIDSFIRKENKALNKLESQKSGLMHDLLTGKKLVSIDKPEASHV